jgi:hypothetical protein
LVAFACLTGSGTAEPGFGASCAILPGAGGRIRAARLAKREGAP